MLALLLVLAILGVTSSIVARSWALRIRREHEDELLFRGNQIRDALASYSRSKPPSGHDRPLRLEDLVLDDRTAVEVHHLRRVFSDPMSGSDFVALRDRDGRIAGVASSDNRAPLKRGGFEPGEERFAAAHSYADWKFVPEDNEGVAP